MTAPLVALLPFLGAAVLLAVFRPALAVLLPLALHATYLVRSGMPLLGTVIPTTFLELLLGVAVVTGVVTSRSAIWRATRALPRVIPILVGLFFVAAILSALIAPHPRTAWGRWRAFVAEPILYALVLLPTLGTEVGRRRVAGALLLGGLTSSGLSLTSGIGSLLSRCPLPISHPVEGLVGPHGASSGCPLTSDFLRLSGIYPVPNALALVLAPLTVFAAVLALSGEPSGLRRLARWSLPFFLVTLLLTQSLGGLAATVLALMFVWAGSRNLLSARKADRSSDDVQAVSLARVRHPIILLVVFLAVGGILLQTLSGKLRHAAASNSPLAARLQIWHVSLALVRDHPFLGTGLGTFEPAYQAKLRALLARNPQAPPPLEWVVPDPHNILLSFWLGTGLLGLLSMGGLVILALRSGFRAVRDPPASSLLPVVASASALLSLLLFGLVDVPYFKNDLALLWWAMLTASVVPPSVPGRRA